MQLGTYGAIFRFAIEFEQACAEFYLKATAFDGRFGELEAGAKKRAARLNRMQREMIVEMILEPIRGLQSTDYHVDGMNCTQETVTSQARALEETGHRFYVDAAARVPIAEVARAFGKLAQEHDNNYQSCLTDGT